MDILNGFLKTLTIKIKVLCIYSQVYHFCVCVLVTQSCPILCHPMDCCPPDLSVHWILQARILEWVAMPSCRGSSRLWDWTQVSCMAGGILYRLSHQSEAPPLLVLFIPLCRSIFLSDVICLLPERLLLSILTVGLPWWLQCWIEWQPTPVFLPGESRRQSPQGHKELDTTEWLAHTHTVWICFWRILSAFVCLQKSLFRLHF